MFRALAPLSLALPVLAACPPEPEPEPIGPVAASFVCEDDGAGGEPDWTFEVGFEGPVDEGRTTVYVETEALPDPSGYAMTVQGTSATTVSFVAQVPGTPTGQDPAPGEVPFACSDVDAVRVTWCANPEGRPDERPCWACDDSSGGSPPGGTEGWIACD